MYTLYEGDCLEVMKQIPNASVDMVLCDLPYGTTACTWDSILPLDLLWLQYRRLTAPQGSQVLFGNNPFTSLVISSNFTDFKQSLVWVKNTPTGALHCRNRFMAKYEDICVFSQSSMGHTNLLGERRMKFNPQGVTATGKTKKMKDQGQYGKHIGARPKQVGREYEKFTGFPHNVLEYDKDYPHMHPTQKPVALLEYLIKTYTNPNDVVLDNTMGSGSTGVACANTGRRFIGIEKDEKYFQIAKKRVEEAYANSLF